MHLIQPGFTCSAFDSFYTNKERTKKFKNAGDYRYTYQNELDKTCFQRHIVYVDFKDLPKKKASDKVLRDKWFNIAKNSKYDAYQ